MARRWKALIASAAAFACASSPAFADSAGVVGKNAFAAQDGKALYVSICQGCHMPDAKGAVGAGAYPSLVKDENLQNVGYPIALVLYGQKAMPGLGGFMDDAQVAAVVNYLRSNFGNDYKDQVSADDVKATRQPGYIYHTLD